MIVTVKVRPVRVRYLAADAEEMTTDIIYFDMPERLTKKLVERRLPKDSILLSYKEMEPQKHQIKLNDKEIKNGNQN